MHGELKTRLLGALLAASGCVMAWLAMIQPLAQARSGAPSISYSLKMVLAVPAMLLLGLIYFLGGTYAANRIRNTETRKLTLLGWLLTLTVLLFGGANYWWFKTQMAALGYQ